MKWLIVFLLFVGQLMAQNSSFGVVKRVIDGDTYVIDVDSYKGQPGTVTLRLVNVDCPELEFKPKRRPAQFYGQNAADSVKNLIEGKEVKITYYGKDFFGRVLGFLYIDGVRLDNIILGNGWGWAYKAYHSKKDYKKGVKYMETARRLRIGLWAFGDPIEPSEYRKL